MELQFKQLQSLYWLWLVVAVAAVLLWNFESARRARERFAQRPLWQHVFGELSVGRKAQRSVLLLLAMLLLVVGMLDPRWGVRYEEVHRRGIDILFVVDVSRSMLAEDVKPNRLQRARDYVLDMLNELGGDRVGLISFAGVPALRCPLTVDYGAFRLSLNELEPESAARGGSLLGDALRLAGESFTDEAKDAKIVIVLSDGEDHGSYPVEAAQKLWDQKGARIFAVGIGDSNEGARIPLDRDGERTYVTYDGQEVWSKLNGDVLRDVALAGQGAYVPAGTTRADEALTQLYLRNIAPLGRSEGRTSRIEVREPRYQWFAGGALLLLCAEMTMRERRRGPGAMN